MTYNKVPLQIRKGNKNVGMGHEKIGDNAIDPCGCRLSISLKEMESQTAPREINDTQVRPATATIQKTAEMPKLVENI